MELNEFFGHLWDDYVRIAPGAMRLHDAVEARGEKIVNDHVAFRTYNIAPINLDALEPHILALGYRRYAPYEFKEKKLRAFGFVHDDPKAPRVFLSELKTEEVSPRSRGIIRGLVAEVDPSVVQKPEVLWAGRLWKPLDWARYEVLRDESEYAAWVSVFGLRANHFTISVNHLETINSLEELLDFVENHGYELNTSGGRVKGNPAVLLEQGSTMGDEVEIEFVDGRREMIPSCYYEFARRYPDPKTGKIYDGFVAASADKIFESTDKKH